MKNLKSKYFEENQYTKITEYYDLWVTSGYYDYQLMAQEANQIIGNGAKVLELGVGTGLLAQEYLKIDPSCELTGVDFTASMLEIAASRVGDRVELIEADAVDMDLNQKFTAAISNGGVWGILDLGDTWRFGGHVPGMDKNIQGLKNTAYHLQPGGLLLLHLQQPHPTYERPLAGGITYAQSIEELEDTAQFSTWLKSYFFQKDGEILAQDQITITCFHPHTSEKILSEARFEFQGTSKGKKFAIYQKT